LCCPRLGRPGPLAVERKRYADEFDVIVFATLQHFKPARLWMRCDLIDAEKRSIGHAGLIEEPAESIGRIAPYGCLDLGISRSRFTTRAAFVAKAGSTAREPSPSAPNNLRNRLSLPAAIICQPSEASDASPHCCAHATSGRAAAGECNELAPPHARPRSTGGIVTAEQRPGRVFE
jgi:hypothetical protein